MLQQYSRALAAETLPTPAPSVVAFGSFGRLDGSSLLSDFDILFLYGGAPQPERIAECRALIQSIVKSNRSMLFDHRRAIEDGLFDFDKSPAYPILSTQELLDDHNELRGIQVITEGRAIRGTAEVQAVRHEILARKGFSENVHQLDLAPLRIALNRSKSSYCNGIIGRLAGDRGSLCNRKILKLFALREFSFIANLFALADVAIATAANIYSPMEAARILSAPSVNKIASFANPTGSFGNIVSSLALDVRKTLTELVAKWPRTDDTPFSVDPTEPPLFAHLRVPVLAVLSRYDALLKLLHDEQFIEMIDRLDPVVTNWIGLRPFQRVITYRSELISGARW